MVKYKFSKDGTVLTIYSAAEVPKSEFQKTLNQIKAIHGDKPIFKRSDRSLVLEWACHNFLFCAGYKMDQTRDCDLDFPCDKPEWIYKLFGRLVWTFIF